MSVNCTISKPQNWYIDKRIYTKKSRFTVASKLLLENENKGERRSASHEDTNFRENIDFSI